MCLALQRRGAEVVVADVNPERTAFAVGLGAVALGTWTRSGASTSSWTPRDATGRSSWPFARAEVGGTIVELSLDGRPFELTAQSLVRRQLTIQGSLTYDHPQDFADTVSRLDGRVGAARSDRDRRVLARRCPARLRASAVRPGQDLDPGRRRRYPRVAADDTAARRPRR